MILAGDIGGTKAEFALYRDASHGLEKKWGQRYSCAQFSSVECLIQHLKNDLSLAGFDSFSIGKAAFAVAGPVENNRCHTTNLPWFVEGDTLARQLQLEHISMLNDVEASALCMPYLSAERFFALTPWQQHRQHQTIAVISPGTGLGQAALFWDGERYHAQASEGGHKDFAAKSALEFALYQYAEAQFPGHVSWERILGGDGFSLIYDFLSQYYNTKDSPEIKESLLIGDKNAHITHLALTQQSDLCQRTLELYVSLLAAETANIALQYMALSGVILSGGIPPKIISALRSEMFITAYLNKGRYRKMLEHIPVQVCLEKNSALLGAAYFAAR